jgi:16S rRNA (adenine1518-N6/adenine1519-N6)-dimethyltransferase
MKKHIAKKRFGQNFLVDDYIINQIIDIINPKKDDNIVEIGPGLGALTKPILNQVSHLHVVEIDYDIIKYLKKSFTDNITIHEMDALKFDFSSVTTHQLRIVGNLPYNISTPLLFHLANYNNIQDMHFMLQREVVDRMCASPNCSDYGRLTIMLQHQFNCTKMLDVGHECFDPQPKVESAIVRLIPKSQDEYISVDRMKLNIVVTKAFNQRRKTISNSLKGLINSETLEKLGIDGTKRAENLSVNDYIALSKEPI